MNHGDKDSQLIGKSVLLLSPSFFNYEIEIKKHLEKMGANVTYINDDPSSLFLLVIGILRALGLSTKYMIILYENRVSKKLTGLKFDYILVICGWAVTSRLSKLLRDYYLKPEGRMLLYYWDSISLLKDDITRWDSYDRIFTFDKDDYNAYPGKLYFLPLFYIDTYKKTLDNPNKSIDLFTVGSFKFNRYYEIEKIVKSNPDICVFSYMFDTEWVIRCHKLFRPKYSSIDLRKLKFKKLSSQEIVSYYDKSNAILDIPRAGQCGLTMRTFECLAMEKKMVTTNPHIVEYDFYNSDNIYVMDTNTYKLPDKAWFEKGYVSLQKDLYEKYSIESWVKQIFCYE